MVRMGTWRLCQRLSQAGIWISLAEETEKLVVGPREVVQQYGELLTQLQAHKLALLTMLREVLAGQILDQPGAPIPKLMTEVCAVCRYPWWAMLPPRRLVMHCTPDGTTMCPGAIQAQHTVAQQLMPAFVAERCIQRHGSVLTWMALRGAITGWAVEQAVLLPPRAYLMDWLDQHYIRVAQHEAYPSWRGLTVTLREWLGDDDDAVVSKDTSMGSQLKRRPVVTA